MPSHSEESFPPRQSAANNLGDPKQENNVAERRSQFAADNNLHHLEHMASGCRMSWLLFKCILSPSMNMNPGRATFATQRPLLCDLFLWVLW